MALQEMVCLTDEGTVTCIIRDTIGAGPKKQSMMQCAPSHTVADIFIGIGNDFHYEPDTFELLLQINKSDMIVLNLHKDKTLGDVGMCFDQDSRNTIIISSIKASSQRNMTLVVNEWSTDDDLLLGASASPTASTTQGVPAFMLSSCKYGGSDNRYSVGYVGLVNQAMTCYLNSLLQALFMTPEFRNALYNWEFDNGCKENISIPFQLQKLFLNLQTSHKSAVETTDLTKSFGWDMSEAWQQHDIQELCRVMFDALEQKFKDTKQADLINNLYEGKMLDYVKCLECSTEKSREDTFLDIPLPVRPFGSTVAYNNVEEALKAFVQPETLDGNNQYHCEKCGKKCDAHKGLKFIKFPYLLTLHLKRFDFDYSTLHRIKLNDKVVFPERLNLNSFILNGANDKSETVEETVKCDDSSTTDSGSALDDESCLYNDVYTPNGADNQECPDDDEGIDMSSENEKNRRHNETKGPYLYELFSIMIHSGSASGGHYYAYIKDFQKNQWFCFNDQIVSRITDDDIRKTYGGGPHRGYYSGAYSSSTNAYMLMYRQIDSERNCSYMTVDDFPSHIKTLLKQMREQEENDRVEREKEIDRCKLKVYMNHPRQNQQLDAKLFVFPETTLDEVTKEAYARFKLDGIVAVDDCRLVSYNKSQDTIESSYDNVEIKLGEILRGNTFGSEWLLEIKPFNMDWQCYKPGGVNMKVFTICLETEEVEGPISVRVNPGECVKDIKELLAKILRMDIDKMILIQENYNGETEHLELDDVPVKFDVNCVTHKLYVANGMDDDPEKPFIISKLHKVIDRFVHIVTLDIVLPNVDSVTLEKYSIPSLNNGLSAVPMEQGGSGDSSPSPPVVHMRISPQPISSGGEGAFSDQSNSEDSSLSDSDRTLVGEFPNTSDGLVQLFSCSNSPADPAQDPYNHEIFGNPNDDLNWEEDEDVAPAQQRSVNFYFKSTPINVCSINDYTDPDDTRSCRVLVDKRMNLANFKKNLEHTVGVPVEFFKVYREYMHQDMEWSRLSDTLATIKDGERLVIKLGRVLKKDEFSGKVYLLTPDGADPFKLLFEWVIAKGSTASFVKKEILIACKKQLMMEINYGKCRIRKKNWKNPAKVYLDDQKFGDDLSISNNWEIFLQELPDGETVTNSDQLVLFVRHWCPSALELKPFNEVVLDSTQMDELKEKVSQLSDIPAEYIEMTLVKSTFPCDMNILDVHTDLEWNSSVSNFERRQLQVFDDGAVFFYRDKREELKELTPEERKELNAKESTRLGKYSTRSYSPRKERALKIYLDSSPNKSEEAGD